MYKKCLTIAIVILFILIYIPSVESNTGKPNLIIENITAVDLSKQVPVELNSKTTSSVSEASNKGYDIALVDIVPYKWYTHFPNVYSLCFGARVKNVGDASYTGNFGYTAVAINLRTNKVVKTFWTNKSGGLQPDESWYMEDDGYGLEFLPGSYFPTIFSLQFSAVPTDSNPENNYLEEKYLIWGGSPGPCYKRIYKTRPINKAYINTPFLNFLQQYPNLFPILQKILCYIL